MNVDKIKEKVKLLMSIEEVNLDRCFHNNELKNKYSYAIEAYEKVLKLLDGRDPFLDEDYKTD